LSLPDVRIIDPVDETDVLGMCQKLWEENGIFPYNEEKVHSIIRNCLHNKVSQKPVTPYAIVGVIGEPGKLQASTCIILGEYYYSDQMHLMELWNYVLPEHRRSKNAEALIEFGKSISDKMKMPLITGIVTEKSLAGKIRLYRRRLGVPLGALFVHGATWEHAPIEQEDFGDIRKRLLAFAEKCAGNKARDLPKHREELRTLLQEAASTIKRLSNDDEIWPLAKRSD